MIRQSAAVPLNFKTFYEGINITPQCGQELPRVYSDAEHTWQLNSELTMPNFGVEHISQRERKGLLLKVQSWHFQAMPSSYSYFM
jgi:hypothetical protein